MHLLGVIALQTRKTQQAVELIHAPSRSTGDHTAHCNLGSALGLGATRRRWRADKAIGWYVCPMRMAMRRGPERIEQYEQALLSCDRALASSLATRGTTTAPYLERSSGLEEAVASCDQASFAAQLP